MIEISEEDYNNFKNIYILSFNTIELMLDKGNYDNSKLFTYYISGYEAWSSMYYTMRSLASRSMLIGNCQFYFDSIQTHGTQLTRHVIRGMELPWNRKNGIVQFIKHECFNVKEHGGNGILPDFFLSILSSLPNWTLESLHVIFKSELNMKDNRSILSHILNKINGYLVNDTQFKTDNLHRIFVKMDDDVIDILCKFPTFVRWVIENTDVKFSEDFLRIVNVSLATNHRM